MKTAVDIYKLLPKTNCGTCGTPTCFGFAVKLSTGQATVELCNSMSEAARKELQEATAGRGEAVRTVFEQTLVSLRPKIAALDFDKAARNFGATLKGPDTLEMTFLNETYRILRDKVLDPSGKEPPAWIAILIYNHLCMPDPPAPAGEWITFGSVPASHAKDKAWAGHVEEVIAKHFSGNVDGLKKACAEAGGSDCGYAGESRRGVRVSVLPPLPCPAPVL